LNLHVAAQQGGAFLNSKQPDGFRIVDFCLGNTAAIVLYLENNLAVGFGEAHFDVSGFRMANDIGERFLKDPEECRIEVLVPNSFLHVGLDFADDAGLVLELSGLPFHGG